MTINFEEKKNWNQNREKKANGKSEIDMGKTDSSTTKQIKKFDGEKETKIKSWERFFYWVRMELPSRNVRSQYPAKIFIFRVIKNNKCDKENIIEREERKKSKDAAMCQGNNKKYF